MSAPSPASRRFPPGVDWVEAVVLSNPGPAGGDLRLLDVPVPEPGPGEVLIEVAFGGCNFADTMMWRGTYPHPKPFPLVAGLEMSGRIARPGPGVTGLKPGQRVAALTENAGCFARFALADAARVIPIPDAVGLDVAAAFPTQALTAWHMLHAVSPVRAGDVVLIHAIGGGVGLYLTQMAVAAGATVFGTVGSPGKQARAIGFGATAVIDRSGADFVTGIAALAGRPVDRLYDSTGATILDRSFGLMRRLGHVVSYGEAEGRPLPNLWQQLVLRSLTFSRFHLGHVDFGSPLWRLGADAVTGAVADGNLAVPIEARFAMGDAPAMYRRLESRSVSGKLLVEINATL